MGFWFRWFGILLAAISLFSLTHKIWTFGLSPIFSDMLAFYRAVFHPIAETIINGFKLTLNLVGIALPHIPADIIIIYALIGSAFLRFALRRLPDGGEYLPGASEMLLLVGGAIIWPLVFVFAMGEIWNKGIKANMVIYYWIMEISISFFTFVIIFATNAYFSI